MFSRPECVIQGADLVRLWIHESRRVYADRFSEASDLQLFHRLQADIAQQASEVNQQNDMFSAVKAFNESASVIKKEDTILFIQMFYLIFILFYEQCCAIE